MVWTIGLGGRKMRYFGGILAALTVAVGVAGGLAGGAAAQDLRDVAGPKELPPASYTGSQYVDSTGCVFVRAGFDGQVTWVPRVNQDRQLVCGFKPTLTPSAGAVAVAPAPEAAPETTPAADAAAPPRRTTAVRAAPAPKAAKPARAAPVAPQADVAAAHVELVSVTTVDAAATPCKSGSKTAERYRLSNGKRYLRCGGPVADPVAYLNSLRLPGIRVVAGPDLAVAGPVAKVAIPEGYEPAWTDGRLNPKRAQGTTEGKAAMARRWTDAVPMKRIPGTEAASVKAAAGRYVQVGAFAVAANADGAAARIGALGLPAARQAAHVGGRPVQIVLAGPFISGADLSEALVRLRGAGYPDAFAR